MVIGMIKEHPTKNRMPRQAKRLGRVVVPKVQGGCVGQQPVFITTEEPARKPWRIMTADSAIDGH
jgi:hypothetical protein